MKKLYFATTNEGKLSEAQAILKTEIESIGLEIDEIQSIDNKKVAIEKAKAYFKEVKKTLFVDDTSLIFNALKVFPGTYINDFTKVLGNDGVLSLLKGHKDRSATAIVTIAYTTNGKDVEVFEGKINGKIAIKPKGTDGHGWDPIFIPKGNTKTFAQMKMDEKNKYSMRTKALQKFKKWLDSKN